MAMDLLEGKKESVLHLLDALANERRERGALLFRVKDCVELLLCAREEVCSHGVRAVLGGACDDVNRECKAARGGLYQLIAARDDDDRFATALGELRRVIQDLRAVCIDTTHHATHVAA